MIITPEQWQLTRSGLREAGGRFVDLLLADTPDARATVHWSVSDTAAHVAMVTALDAFMLRPDGGPHPFGPLEPQLAVTTVDTLSELNRQYLDAFPQRDRHLLAGQLSADIDLILDASAGLDPAQPLDWLGGARLPLAGLLAHLLNELLIHGRDIARATGSGWTIPPQEAAMFLELFLVGVTRYGNGRLLDSDELPRDRRIAVAFRSAYTTPFMMVLHNGRVAVEAPDPGADVRLWFDPAVLNLVMFGRISRLRAALTGKLRVSGRRPWLLPAFLRTMRMPS